MKMLSDFHRDRVLAEADSRRGQTLALLYIGDQIGELIRAIQVKDNPPVIGERLVTAVTNINSDLGPSLKSGTAGGDDRPKTTTKPVKTVPVTTDPVTEIEKGQSK